MNQILTRTLTKSRGNGHIPSALARPPRKGGAVGISAHQHSVSRPSQTDLSRSCVAIGIPVWVHGMTPVNDVSRRVCRRINGIIGNSGQTEEEVSARPLARAGADAGKSGYTNTTVTAER